MDIALIRSDIKHLQEVVDKGFSQVGDQLNQMNGSVRQHETRISLLEEFCRDRVKPALDQIVENRVQIATILAKYAAAGFGATGGVGVGVFLIGKAVGWW